MRIKVKYVLYFLSTILELFLFTFGFMYSIWTTKLIKILFWINIILVFITSIYSLVFISIFLIYKAQAHFSLKMYSLSFNFFEKSNIILYIVIYISSEYLNSSNDYRLSTYRKNCPFSLTSNLYLNNSTYFEPKRCELYNIYNNSRYRYQYICSYNPYDSMKNEKTKDGLEKMQCVPKFNNIQENFKLINKFTNIYHKNNISQLYYCNRVDMPIKDEFIPEKYCNDKKLQNEYNFLFFKIAYLIAVIFKNIYKDLQTHMHVIIGLELIEELERIIKDKDDCSTDNDEPNSNDVSFIEEEDVNMIVENNNVKMLDVNIANFGKNEEKEKQD